jgi:type II secretory pathway pseudopilin PulG
VTEDVVALALFGVVAVMGLIGIVAFSYFGRSARVEMARRAGESEAAIQRQLATIKRIRNLCLSAFAVGVVGASWFLLASQSQ